jgi:hypothetical protein
MERGTNLDDYFRTFAKQHPEIKDEASAIRANPPKPRFKWSNQIWPGYNISPQEINRLQRKHGRRLILTDHEKIKWDINFIRWDKEERLTRVEVIIDEWALHYSTYKVEKWPIKPTEEDPRDYYWIRVDNSENVIGSWPFCIVKTVKNPKTGDEEFFWESGAPRTLRYIRLEEKYFSQLRHEIFFRGLRIPAFHSKYGGTVLFQGKETATKYIENYLEEMFRLEDLILFNKMLKGIQVENIDSIKKFLGAKRAPYEANLQFPQLYADFIGVIKKVKELKTEIARVRRFLPPPDESSGSSITEEPESIEE